VHAATPSEKVHPPKNGLSAHDKPAPGQ
jgi:hypothetical protein